MTNVETPSEIRQRRASMRSDQLQIRVLIQKSRKDHMRKRQRRIKHKAHRRDEVECFHVHLTHPLRGGRMNENRQAQLVDFRPDRREFRKMCIRDRWSRQ